MTVPLDPRMMRTPEEREESRRKDIRGAYFEPGRTYTFDWWHTKERQAIWIENFWHPTGYVWRWTAFIKQAECPWMIIHCESFRSPIGMWLWARKYLKLGRPPGWDADPEVMVRSERLPTRT